MSINNPKKSHLVPAICTQCGGSVEVVSSHEKAFCNHCGTTFIVEKAINNYNVQHAKVEHVESMNVYNNKRGAVESVLNFVEKQQDKQQKKIDEERRRQQEEIVEVLNQMFNKKYRKRNLILIGIAAIVICIFICISIISGVANEMNKENMARIPGGSSYQEGRNYLEVVSDFEENGFTNIKTEKKEDLILGLFSKDGEVESVSIDGDVYFSANDWYPKDVKVIIIYHTFPED